MATDPRQLPSVDWMEELIQRTRTGDLMRVRESILEEFKRDVEERAKAEAKYKILLDPVESPTAFDFGWSGFGIQVPVPKSKPAAAPKPKPKSPEILPTAPRIIDLE